MTTGRINQVATVQRALGHYPRVKHRRPHRCERQIPPRSDGAQPNRQSKRSRDENPQRNSSLLLNACRFGLRCSVAVCLIHQPVGRFCHVCQKPHVTITRTNRLIAGNFSTSNHQTMKPDSSRKIRHLQIRPQLLQTPQGNSPRFTVKLRAANPVPSAKLPRSAHSSPRKTPEQPVSVPQFRKGIVRAINPHRIENKPRSRQASARPSMNVSLPAAQGISHCCKTPSAGPAETGTTQTEARDLRLRRIA